MNQPFNCAINTGQEMKYFIQEGLFHTIAHIKANNNFQLDKRNPNAQQIVQKWPLFILVGNILNLEGVQIGNEECYKINIKTSYDGQVKAMLMRKTDYKDFLCRQFNRIMKNKNQKYIFANLKCALFDANLYFMIGPQTYIIQALAHFYEQRLKPIELFPKFQFSHLNLSKAFSSSQICQYYEQGFTVNLIKKRFQSVTRQNATIVGYIQIVNRVFEKNSNKLKRLIMKITQSNFEKKYYQIGIGHLQLRYSIDEEEYVDNLIKNHSIYLFSNPQIIITENLQLMFVIGSIKNHCILRLSDQSYHFDLDSIIHHLQFHNIQQFKSKYPNNNLVKLAVTLISIQTLHAIYKCRSCGYEIKGGRCDGECLQTSGRIELIGIVRVADSTGLCLLFLQNKTLIQFLQLQPYLDEIEKIVEKQRESVIIIEGNNWEQKNRPMDEDLKKITIRLNRILSEKVVVGYNKTKMMNKETSQMLQSEKQDGMQNGKKAKKYNEYKTIFPNGLLDKKNQVQPFLPFVRVQYVYGFEY